MADETLIDDMLSKEIAYYLEPVELTDLLPINKNNHSATQETMISLFGAPLMPLTTSDQPSNASPLVKRLRRTQKVSQHIVVTAIGPALDSLKKVLELTFNQEKEDSHDLESVLSTDGMLVVRLRKPTSGRPSTKISNHSWGTAIDLKIIGHSSPGNTHNVIPRFIAVLLSNFNKEGWFSGIGFDDTMHFEVSEERINEWSNDGLLH
jgi:hypothetical protein